MMCQEVIPVQKYVKEKYVKDKGLHEFLWGRAFVFG